MRHLFIIAFLPLFFSCGDAAPGGVLPKEKMQKVMWDVARGSEFLNGYVYYKHPEQNRALVNNEMLNRILKIHKVNKKQFDKSLRYYQNHPQLFIEILDSITAKQSRLRGDSTGNAGQSALPPSSTLQ